MSNLQNSHTKSFDDINEGCILNFYRIDRNAQSKLSESLDSPMGSGIKHPNVDFGLTNKKVVGMSCRKRNHIENARKKVKK